MTVLHVIKIQHPDLQEAFKAFAKKLGYQDCSTQSGATAARIYYGVDFEEREIGTFYHIPTPAIKETSLDALMEAMQKNADVLLHIGKYEVRCTGDGIKVGCEFVSREQVRVIAKALNLIPPQYRILDCNDKIKAGDEYKRLTGPTDESWWPVADWLLYKPGNYLPDHVVRRIITNE